MFRTAYVMLSVLALTIIATGGNPAKAGGYYEGDGYYSGNRSSYYGDRDYRSDRSSSYGDRDYRGYRSSYRYRDDSYYERPYRRSYHYRSSYYARPAYYGTSYTSGYYNSSYSSYDAYDSDYKCAPHRIRDIGGGWITTVQAGCPNVN